MNEHIMIVAGIDTGKLELHVCLLPGERRFTVTNDAAGIAALVEACRAAGVGRCGIESTSIYHRQAARALRLAGFAEECQESCVRGHSEEGERSLAHGNQEGSSGRAFGWS